MNLRGKIIPIAVVIAILAGYVYFNYFDANVPESLEDEGYLKIPTGSTYQDLVNILKSKRFIEDEGSFGLWARYMEQYAQSRPV